MTFLNKISPDDMQRLLLNGAAAKTEIEEGEGHTDDIAPVVRVYIPGTRSQWLLTEYDEEFETFFGLCDLGQGFPEIGYVGLADFEEVAAHYDLIVDTTFQTKAPLSRYQEAARHACAITLAID